MASNVTLKTVMSEAASLDRSEWRDVILFHLEKMDYCRALIVCGEAVLESLKRETDLSVGEFTKRMQECNRLERN